MHVLHYTAFNCVSGLYVFRDLVVRTANEVGTIKMYRIIYKLCAQVCEPVAVRRTFHSIAQRAAS